jgi:hypothetical protein
MGAGKCPDNTCASSLALNPVKLGWNSVVALSSTLGRASVANASANRTRSDARDRNAGIWRRRADGYELASMGFRGALPPLP